MSTFDDLLLDLRKPEYTGENRCIPCTMVNIVIAIVVSVALALILVTFSSQTATAAIGIGTAVLVASLAAIGLRGYLVPYTPTLTKRYFPERVLRWFDKSAEGAEAVPELSEELDIEEQLRSIGVVEPCTEIDDLCLTPSFKRTWRERITELRETERDSRVAELRTLLELEDEHDIEEIGDTAAVVMVDDVQVGQWESEAALIADLAANAVFREWTEEWTSRPVAERSQLLNSTRMFLEQCPSCDAPVTLGQKTVESCCRSWDVVTVRCESCDARLFEVRVTPEMEEQLAA